MMDGDAIKELATRFRQPALLENGFLVRPDDWVTEDPAALVKPGPMATTLVVHTLGAVVNYLDANRDQLDLKSVLLHVVTPTTVSLLGPLEERARVRETFVQAKASDFSEGFLGRFMPLDEFILGLQVRFADADDRKKLLQLLSTVKNESVKTAMDDGMTQVVQARAGVALVSDVSVPNPVLLAAYRTFRDVVQPSALYVLRLNVGKAGGLPEVGLFEGDGGAWRLIAIERVRRWLSTAMDGSPAAVAILG